MNTCDRLDRMRDIIQEDVGNRGLRADPASNLITATAGDFAAACRSIAEHLAPRCCVVTGFFIPHGQPPACETDGPLGALFLARALERLNIPLLVVADRSLEKALQAGLDAAGCRTTTTAFFDLTANDSERVTAAVFPKTDPVTHLIALERVGPSHTPASIRAQPGTTPEIIEIFERTIPAAEHDRCHSMRGRDISEYTGPAHLLFEHARKLSPAVVTIGIGDGGNEIGMGKLPWDLIRRNIPNGGVVACRVPADHLIVAGVSNWGAYALAAGIALLRGERLASDLFDVEQERALLRVMVEVGPLVDGVLGRQQVSVDGLSFEEYGAPLRRLASC